MSEQDYMKWNTEKAASSGVTKAHLSAITAWAGGISGHRIWGAINQYLPSNINTQPPETFKAFSVTTRYSKDDEKGYEGIELILNEERNQESEWGNEFIKLAELVVFQLTDDNEDELKAKARDGGKIENVASAISEFNGFTLKNWTLKYRKDNQFDGNSYFGGLSVMLWEHKDSGQESVLSWSYIPYVSPK